MAVFFTNSSSIPGKGHVAEQELQTHPRNYLSFIWDQGDQMSL
jgi:hypothetical protein